MNLTFVEPLDVLLLRGNKLFGDPGSYGESLIPPWPSVAAGAVRSRMLVDDGVDLAAFSQSRIAHPTLGTPSKPGSFVLTGFHLARRLGDGTVEALFAPPADLVIQQSETGHLALVRLHPVEMHQAMSTAFGLPKLPVLAQSTRSKPVSGYWLNASAWRRYLAGEMPATSDLVCSADLWSIDHRVGIGLDAQQRSAADGQLFSMQAVALRKREHQTGADCDVGFAFTVSGAEPPQAGLLRLGGDGRGAALHASTSTLPRADHAAIAAARRCRIVLTSPGLFAEGWRLPGCDADNHFQLQGVRGRLVSAAVPRHDVVSGWDLARRQPKAAQRVAPIGSVYWLEDLDTSEVSLDKLAAAGLWGETCEDPSRRAEGFNRFTFAAY